MSFAKMIMESDLRHSKSQASSKRSSKTDLGDSFIQKLNENLQSLTEEANQLKNQFSSNETEKMTQDEVQNMCGDFFVFEDRKNTQSNLKSDENGGLTQPLNISTNSIRIEDMEDYKFNPRAKQQQQKTRNGLFGKMKGRKESYDSHQYSDSSESVKNTIFKNSKINGENAHEISFESKNTLDLKDKIFNTKQSRQSNLFNMPSFNEQANDNLTKPSTESTLDKSRQRNLSNVESNFSENSNHAHNLKERALKHDLEFGGSFRGPRNNSISVVEERNSFLKEQSKNLSPTRQNDQLIEIYVDESNEKAFPQKNKRLSIFGAGSAKQYSEDEVDDEEGSVTSEESLEMGSKSNQPDEEDIEQNIQNLREIMKGSQGGLISLTTSLLNAGEKLGLKSQNQSLMSIKQLSRSKSRNKNYDSRSSQSDKYSKQSRGYSKKNLSRKESRVSKEDEFSQLVNQINEQDKETMLKMLQDHFDSQDEDFDPAEETPLQTVEKSKQSLNDTDILDDRRVLFESNIRKQLESSPNFDHLGSFGADADTLQGGNSFHDMSKISGAKSNTNAQSIEDSCLDILEPNLRPPTPQNPSFHMSSKSQKSSKTNKHQEKNSSRLTMGVKSSKHNAKEQTVNSSKNKSISSLKTSQMIQMLNQSRTKSSTRNSFVTMGDDQIENLRNMFFKEDSRNIYSSIDTDLESEQRGRSRHRGVDYKLPLQRIDVNGKISNRSRNQSRKSSSRNFKKKNSCSKYDHNKENTYENKKVKEPTEEQMLKELSKHFITQEPSEQKTLRSKNTSNFNSRNSNLSKKSKQSTGSFRRPSEPGMILETSIDPNFTSRGNMQDDSVAYDISVSRLHNSKDDEPSMVFLERQKIERMKDLIKKLEMENMLLKGYARYGINPDEALKPRDMNRIDANDGNTSDFDTVQYDYSKKQCLRNPKHQNQLSKKSIYPKLHIPDWNSTSDFQTNSNGEISSSRANVLYKYGETEDYVRYQIENHAKFRKKNRTTKVKNQPPIYTPNKRAHEKSPPFPQAKRANENFKTSSRNGRTDRSTSRSSKIMGRNGQIRSSYRRRMDNSPFVVQEDELKDFNDIVEKVPRNSYCLIHMKKKRAVQRKTSQ